MQLLAAKDLWRLKDFPDFPMRLYTTISGQGSGGRGLYVLSGLIYFIFYYPQEGRHGTF